MSTRIHINDEFDDDEIEGSIYSKYKLGDSVSRLSEIGKVSPLFSYEYVSLNNTSYCFDYENLEHKDYSHYFIVVNKLGSKSINDLIDKSSHELHFKIVDLTRNYPLLEKIKSQLKIKKKLNVNEYPLICQFALYTDDRDDNPDAKAPRVISMIHKGIFLCAFF